MKKLKRIWKNYALSIVLLSLFLITSAAHAIFNWYEYVDQAAMHGAEVTTGGYLVDFFTRTFENWQSEFLQLFSMVVLTAALIHKGSSESKDSNEDMQQSLNRIEDRLMKLEKKR